MTDSDLAALKRAMANAHPDRGGTNDTFIEARKAFLAAKWKVEKDRADAERRQHEEAECRRQETAAAAEEERRQREAAEATAKFRGRAAKATCACAAALLVFVVAALYKEHAVDAGRHGDSPATSMARMQQFAPSKPFENASADKPRQVSTVAVTGDSVREKEADAPVRSAAAESPKPEKQARLPLQAVTPAAPEVMPPALPVPLAPTRKAELVVYHLTDVENRGNVDDLSAYYSDRIDYYGKPTAKSAVVADKTRFMRRWPNRKYTIRPQSLTVACDNIRCTADGMIDFDVSNAAKRSIGTASFTYHMLMKHNNSEPPDFLVTAEDSVVVTRTVIDVGQPAQTMAAPWRADRGQGQ